MLGSSRDASRRGGCAAALGLALLLPGIRPALAVKPESSDFSDAKRFGLDHTRPASYENTGRSPFARTAIDRFNRGPRPRLSSGGASISAASTRAARVADARTIAETFLRQNRDWLNLVPEELNLEFARSEGGIHHLLFSQVHEGVPVEFSRIKVHLSDAGEVLSFQSSYRPKITLSPIPAVSETAAARTVASDLGGAPPSGGRLVYYPLPESGQLRLAWKFRLGGAGGHWVYYVDAASGALLFRYNDLRHATSGTITGKVYDIDPSSTPLILRPMAHETVYVQSPATFSLTDAAGAYSQGNDGKIFTALQGPFINVANANAPNAHYDNGSGTWSTFASAVSSPHPYPDSSVLVSTVNFVSAPPGTVKLLVNFTAFDVGAIDVNGNITDDDQVAVLDANGNPVASYIGSKGGFRSAAVPGTQIRLRLASNAGGGRFGYNVDVSSYLVLSNPNVAGPGSAFTWTSTATFDGTLDEVNVFYHLNKMHDYLTAGVDAAGTAAINGPLLAMTHLGPGVANAFYDPLQGSISYGDGGGGIALDATVVRHEYVHFMVDQIYPLAQFANFGQSGALSEAFADYFAASSLNDSSIGKYAGGTLGEGTLRELDCGSHPPCKAFPAQWTGEVHQDSLMISQALWEIRASAGQACADNLAFQSLSFFPDSFQDFLEAMLILSGKSSSIPGAPCGPDHTQDGLINARFFTHGTTLNPSDQDPYEPNDGIQTATNLSTASVIRARIFPAADLDWYTFGAGAGLISVTLNLPNNPAVPGGYFAYALTLVDRNYNTVATALPPVNVNGTAAGNCPNTGDCTTTAPQVVLNYSNPSSNQFFLLLSGAPTDSGSNSNVNSTLFYTMNVAYNQTGPVGAAIVNASFDRDTISFSVLVSTFVRTQNYGFRSARLLDQSLAVLPQTSTDQSASYLVSIATTDAGGMMTGQLRLRPGFAARFPAAGSVHLEVFAADALGVVQSLGYSPEINLTTNQADLTAWNNVFNPSRGEKATFKYETLEPGNVTLKLYTMSGTLVNTLLDGYRPAGKGSVDWAGANGAGHRVASGIYLLHVHAPGLEKTQKVVVVK